MLKNVSSGEIAALAKRNGLRVLSEDGWRLVRQGATTVEEVLSVTTAKEVSRTSVDEKDGGGETAAELAVAR